MATATIPLGRNLAHDPRPTATTYIAVPGGSTRTLVTDRSYSGTSSVFVTLAAGATLTWSAATPGDADLTALGLAGTYNSAFHTSGPIPAGLNAQLRLTYNDATIAATTLTPVNNATTRFERTNLPALLASATKPINAIDILLINSTGSAMSFYVGGIDIRRQTSPIDGFIHGSAGPTYSWEGTANNSPSNRAFSVTAPIIGSGGSVYPTVKLFVVNRQNQIIREITDHFLDGDVSYDMDADAWKGSCRLILDDPNLIQPLAIEFIRIVLHLDYPDGTSEEGSIGQFMVDLPSERWSSGSDQWTYAGKDLLGIFATTMARDGYGVNAGQSYLSIINDVCFRLIGLSPSQVSFPAVTQVHAAKWSWERSTTILKILTDELQAVGLQKPWVSPLGVVTSAVAGTNPAAFPASLVLATGQDSKLRWPFQVDPETAGIGNRVQVVSSEYIANYHWNEAITIHGVASESVATSSVSVTSYNITAAVEAQQKKKNNKKKDKKGGGGKHGKNNPGQEPPPDDSPPDDPAPNEPPPVDPPPPEDTIIPGYWDDGYDPRYGLAVNDDPSHPISHARLGRWIDLPDINIPQVSGQAEADAIARDALVKASVLPMRARVTTVVMLRGLNEVYRLDLMDSNGNPIESGQGNYFCRGWTLQLGLPWEMVHTLTRVIDFAALPYF